MKSRIAGCCERAARSPLSGFNISVEEHRPEGYWNPACGNNVSKNLKSNMSFLFKTFGAFLLVIF